MKIAITGITSGIGQGIAELYLEHGHTVVGFNRSNGYNIDTAQAKIVDEISDCDIFVNNAYSNTDILAQSELFKKVFDMWRHQKKTIVNINSRAHYGNAAKPYSKGKKMLHREAFLAVNHLDRKCKIINISPGYVDTPRVNHITEYSMLTVKEIANYVKWAIDQPIEIGELSLWRDA